MKYYLLFLLSFSSVSTAGNLSVLSPAPGTNYAPDDPFYIEWQLPAGAAGGQLWIELVDYRGMAVKTTHVTNAPSRGRLDLIRGSLPSGQYRLQFSYEGNETAEVLEIDVELENSVSLAAPLPSIGD